MKIETSEQYNSVKELGYLLEKFCLVESFVEDLIFEYGEEFEMCRDCDETIVGCRCERELYNPYSDEDSFE